MRAWVERHPVSSYFVMAYTLSWSIAKLTGIARHAELISAPDVVKTRQSPDGKKDAA